MEEAPTHGDVATFVSMDAGPDENGPKIYPPCRLPLFVL